MFFCHFDRSEAERRNLLDSSTSLGMTLGKTVLGMTVGETVLGMTGLIPCSETYAFPYQESSDRKRSFFQEKERFFALFFLFEKACVFVSVREIRSIRIYYINGKKRCQEFRRFLSQKAEKTRLKTKKKRFLPQPEESAKNRLFSVEPFAHRAARVHHGELLVSEIGFLNERRLQQVKNHAQRHRRSRPLRIIFIRFAVDVLR